MFGVAGRGMTVNYPVRKPYLPYY